MSFRKYELGSYEEMCERHSWEVPERYNIATDVCDKHDRDRPAMVWEDWEGNERRVDFGELQKRIDFRFDRREIIFAREQVEK